MLKIKRILDEILIEAELPKKKWIDVDPNQHTDELIHLVQTAYKKSSEGSFINSKSDLNGSDWHSIDFDNEPGVDATIFYRKPRGGESWKGMKIQGVGHDGTRESINVMLNRLKKLLNKNGVWSEASDALEHILYKLGSPYVTDESLAQKIFPKTNLKFIGDRGKYTRRVGSKKVKETIFGKPKL